MAEELGPSVRTAVWVGPGHVQDFISGMPNCMVIASADEDLTHFLVDTFTSPLIRFYYGQDLLASKSARPPRTSWASLPVCSTALI